METSALRGIEVENAWTRRVVFAKALKKKPQSKRVENKKNRIPTLVAARGTELRMRENIFRVKRT